MKNSILKQSLIALFLLHFTACDIKENVKKSDKNSEVSTDENKVDAQKTKQAYLKRLLQQIREAIDNRDFQESNRLINIGLAEVENTNREYEVEKAFFMLSRGEVLIENSNTNDARRFLGDAMAVFRVTKNTEGTFGVNLALVTLEENVGNIGAARRHLDDAKEIIDKISDKRLLADYRLKEGNLLVATMKYEEASKYFYEARQIFQDIKLLKKQADTYLNLAYCEDGMGDTKQSRSSIEKALSIYKSINDKTGEVVSMHKLAALYARDEQYKQARPLFEKVEKLYIELGRLSDASKVRQQVAAFPL
ncbi:MAG: tetratricopeptide repeat protein [Deltaproteobacteria bacterium]|nr:tetratricopeptide repeat protein [Deltaproteobacteria bacterium]